MADTQLNFCRFRWNNYQSRITKAFEDLFNDEAFMDVTLACEGKSLKAHRVILSACSSYFTELLKSTPCKHPVIMFQNVAFRDLHALVGFIYHGEVSVHQSFLSSFLKTAETLGISGFTQQVDQTDNSEDVQFTGSNSDELLDHTSGFGNGLQTSDLADTSQKQGFGDFASLQSAIKIDYLRQIQQSPMNESDRCSEMIMQTQQELQRIEGNLIDDISQMEFVKSEPASPRLDPLTDEHESCLSSNHIIKEVPQDMATHSHGEKNQIKRKRSNQTEPDMYPTKVMYLPPNYFIENDSAASSTIEIHKNFSPLVQKKLLSSSSLEDKEQEEYLEEEFAATEDNNDEVDEDESNKGPVNAEDGQEDGHNAICCNNCKEERKRFENLIMRKINELLEVVRANNNPIERRNQNYTLLPAMPFDTIDALIQFDHDLNENEQMRDQFIQKIQEIGGKTVQKATKYAMETVMTDTLTQKVVWTLGAENVPKISKFKFPYIIIDVIRNAFQGTKLKTLEDRIADWLRRGGDRLRAARIAENKRRERNLEQQ